MRIFFTLLFFLSFCLTSFSQKDSLQLGDKYSDDQIYASISYAQFNEQPNSISKSNFSYALSVGFIKDFILNKQGNLSVAAGVGYGVDFFNHKLKVEEINNTTIFSSDNTISGNLFKSHNLEFPLELRWRTSTANKYNFWRVYAGIKFLYNIANKFQFEDANNNSFSYSNITSYNKFQYGLTLNVGWNTFNIHAYYALNSLFQSSARLNGQRINVQPLRLGFIFYIL